MFLYSREVALKLLSSYSKETNYACLLQGKRWEKEVITMRNNLVDNEKEQLKKKMTKKKEMLDTLIEQKEHLEKRVTRGKGKMW